MKKIFLLLMAAGGFLSTNAQSTDGVKHKKPFYADSFLSKWVIDANFLGGMLKRDFTKANTDANYTNGIGLNTGYLKFTNGMSYGGDIQVAYFFDRKGHFGIGAGFKYLYQTGDAILDKYSVQYQSIDNTPSRSTFRQVINANNPIKESLTITNMNIPVYLKYKNRFSKHFGFTADIGLLYNLQMTNSYKTDATFDYEAIYQYASQNGNGNPVAVYDAATVPSSSDWLITQQQIGKHNFTDGTVLDTFNSLRAQGYNVGLGMGAGQKTGDVSFNTGSLGFIVRPCVSYYFSDRVALNLGVYYMYQQPRNNVPSGYRLTDGVGSYSSVMNSVTKSVDQSYGLNLGLRFYLGRVKDKDHDMIPNKFDKCPDDSGLAIFNGCPDKDGDGIPDFADSCVDVPGLAKYNGCPDTDGDGIPDNLDACPKVPGLAKYHGCPDKDGDGVPDNEDACPDVPGLAMFHGCPDTDGDGVPDKEDRCPNVYGPAANFGCPYDTARTPAKVDRPDISTPILFDVNKTIIHESSYPVLREAILELNEEPNSSIVIDGYTDITASPAYNKVLSQRRAEAVRDYLMRAGGINGSRLIPVGHGINDPIAPNDTEEGRAKNRRVIMSMKH